MESRKASGRAVVRTGRPRTTDPPPSRAGKRLISAFVEPEVLKAFKILVAENDSTIQQTLIDLLNDYFVRHGKKPIAR